MGLPFGCGEPGAAKVLTFSSIILLSGTPRIQPNQGLLAERVPDAAKADGETFNRRTVRAVKLTGQDMSGDVKPRSAIGWQVVGSRLKQIQNIAFVLADGGFEFGRAIGGQKCPQVVACGFKPPAQPFNREQNFHGRSQISSSINSFGFPTARDFEP
jgi:hypothetical protein